MSITEKAKKKGRAAHKNGTPISDNPFANILGSSAVAASAWWTAGWRQGEYEAAKSRVIVVDKNELAR